MSIHGTSAASRYNEKLEIIRKRANERASERETVRQVCTEAATSQVRSPKASGRHVAEAPRPCQLPTPAPKFSPRRSGSRSIPTTAPSSPSPPSHRYAALCKSPHMLPRVPVSQRHSRALFRALVTRYGSLGGQEGGDKTLFSLSFSLSTSRAREDTEGERHPRNHGHCAHRYRERGRPGVCVLCACVYVTCTRARATSSLFSASRGAAATSSSNRHVRTKAEEQLIGWSDRIGEEEERSSPPPFPCPLSIPHLHALPFSLHFTPFFPPPHFFYFCTSEPNVGAPRRVWNYSSGKYLPIDLSAPRRETRASV